MAKLCGRTPQISSFTLVAFNLFRPTTLDGSFYELVLPTREKLCISGQKLFKGFQIFEGRTQLFLLKLEIDEFDGV